MQLTIYQYPKCSTCRKALAWLKQRDIAVQVIDIVTAPPTRAELARLQEAAAVPVKKLFNTAGESYRAGGWKDRLADTSDADAFAALARDGKLIKRPLLSGNGIALIGFDEAAWQRALGLRG
mgnify:CR=1 FL=1